jgi:hypothetical protein
MTGGRAFSFPPDRLAPVTDRQLAWLRPLWFLVLALAIVLDIAGTVFVLRDIYHNDPAFNRLGMVSQVENDGSITVEAIPGISGTPRIVPGSRIATIDGQRVARNTPVWDLAERLSAREGQLVSLGVVSPGGQAATYPIVASQRYIEEAQSSGPIDRDLRLGIRLALSLLTCVTLITCAVLLFLRRPQDPVALLFSFSFLLFAGTIDPPLALWLAAGTGSFYDAYSLVGWVLLVTGLAVFPDGKFTPRAAGWVPVAALIAAPLLADDTLSMVTGSFIAFIAPLSLLACHVIKYRRFPPGIERQQVKWAAFGFAGGLLLLTAAFLLTAAWSEPGLVTPVHGLIIITLFNLGFMAMALGLLVSLIRFRLWEADRVISRSAISAAVTLAVGIVWTLSVDLLKVGVEWVLGEENETVATIAGAILAAGIFAPTQALAMRWAKVRLAGDESRIQRLIDRLAVWRTTETPEEIGVRTLSALAAAVHCNGAALLIDGPRGLQLLAARDVEDAEALGQANYEPSADSRFAIALPLEDEDGPIGQLLVGPRSDLNRYNAAQLDGLTAITEPLAEALRAALKRARHVESVHLQLGSVEERLARLEQSGGPRLSPT